MACNKNINELLNLDFSAIVDEFEWIYNTDVPIVTEGGQLKLTPNAATSSFRRNIGTIDPTNNRIRLQIDCDILRPTDSTQNKIDALVEIYNGSLLIDSFTLYVDELEQGQLTEYNFDRIFKYEDLGGSISLKITTTDGWENVLFLNYLKCEDYNFCDDNVRNYFVFENLFEDSIQSVSSAVQLLEWKIDGVETLTPAFFSENNSPGGNPIAEWFFANANLDGSNRVPDIVEQNSFNPFISEFGLDFDVANYYDGKPTGVTSGSDYGTGILQIGIDKPVILNGTLLNKKGAFFIDIDYTKNVKIVMNVLVNDTNANVFDSPRIFREYTIIWNSSTCSGQYFYKDVLNSYQLTDQYVNGFLSGITGVESVTLVTIPCGQPLAYSGNGAGTYEATINFGTDVGSAGIEYNAYGVPDKFEIEWNGQIFSSGYVGLNAYDQDLLNVGVPVSEIKTGDPSTGNGFLYFNKNQAYPTTATIRVASPFASTSWVFEGICPIDTGASETFIWKGFDVNARVGEYFSIAFETNDLSTFVPSNGGVIYTNSLKTERFNGDGFVFSYRRQLGTSWNSESNYDGETYTFRVNTDGTIEDLIISNDRLAGVLAIAGSLDGCIESKVLTVDVPVGTSDEYKLEFRGYFYKDSNYSQTAPSIGGTIDQIITSDQDVIITETTKFQVTIAGGYSGTTIPVPLGIYRRNYIIATFKINGVRQGEFAFIYYNEGLSCDYQP